MAGCILNRNVTGSEARTRAQLIFQVRTGGKSYGARKTTKSAPLKYTTFGWEWSEYCCNSRSCKARWEYAGCVFSGPNSKLQPSTKAGVQRRLTFMMASFGSRGYGPSVLIRIVAPASLDGWHFDCSNRADAPAGEHLVTLSGTPRGTSVARIAELEGIRIGDELVSINGKQPASNADERAAQFASSGAYCHLAFRRPKSEVAVESIASVPTPAVASTSARSRRGPKLAVFGWQSLPQAIALSAASAAAAGRKRGRGKATDTPTSAGVVIDLTSDDDGDGDVDTGSHVVATTNATEDGQLAAEAAHAGAHASDDQDAVDGEETPLDGESGSASNSADDEIGSGTAAPGPSSFSSSALRQPHSSGTSSAAAATMSSAATQWAASTGPPLPRLTINTVVHVPPFGYGHVVRVVQKVSTPRFGAEAAASNAGAPQAGAASSSSSASSSSARIADGKAGHDATRIPASDSASDDAAAPPTLPEPNRRMAEIVLDTDIQMIEGGTLSSSSASQPPAVLEYKVDLWCGVTAYVTSESPHFAPYNLDQSDSGKVAAREVGRYPAFAARNCVSLSVGDAYRYTPTVYLNDNNVEFYLRYVHRELMAAQQRNLSHVFGTYFYSQLCTKLNKIAQTWTLDPSQPLPAGSVTVKNVADIDPFLRQFLFVPVNDKLHWSIAVVCNPGLLLPDRYGRQRLPTIMTSSGSGAEANGAGKVTAVSQRQANTGPGLLQSGASTIASTTNGSSSLLRLHAPAPAEMDLESLEARVEALEDNDAEDEAAAPDTHAAASLPTLASASVEAHGPTVPPPAKRPRGRPAASVAAVSTKPASRTSSAPAPSASTPAAMSLRKAATAQPVASAPSSSSSAGAAPSSALAAPGRLRIVWKGETVNGTSGSSINSKPVAVASSAGLPPSAAAMPNAPPSRASGRSQRPGVSSATDLAVKSGSETSPPTSMAAAERSDLNQQAQPAATRRRSNELAAPLDVDLVGAGQPASSKRRRASSAAMLSAKDESTDRSTTAAAEASAVPASGKVEAKLGLSRRSSTSASASARSSGTNAQAASASASSSAAARGSRRKSAALAAPSTVAGPAAIVYDSEEDSPSDRQAAPPAIDQQTLADFSSDVAVKLVSLGQSAGGCVSQLINTLGSASAPVAAALTPPHIHADFAHLTLLGSSITTNLAPAQLLKQSVSGEVIAEMVSDIVASLRQVPKPSSGGAGTAGDASQTHAAVDAALSLLPQAGNVASQPVEMATASANTRSDLATIISASPASTLPKPKTAVHAADAALKVNLAGVDLLDPSIYLKLRAIAAKEGADTAALVRHRRIKQAEIMQQVTRHILDGSEASAHVAGEVIDLESSSSSATVSTSETGSSAAASAVASAHDADAGISPYALKRERTQQAAYDSAMRTASVRAQMLGNVDVVTAMTLSRQASIDEASASARLAFIDQCHAQATSKAISAYLDRAGLVDIELEAHKSKETGQHLFALVYGMLRRVHGTSGVAATCAGAVLAHARGSDGAAANEESCDAAVDSKALLLSQLWTLLDLLHSLLLHFEALHSLCGNINSALKLRISSADAAQRRCRDEHKAWRGAYDDAIKRKTTLPGELQQEIASCAEPPTACIILLDSLKMHRSQEIGMRIRKYLEAEFRNRYMSETEKMALWQYQQAPTKQKSLLLKSASSPHLQHPAAVTALPNPAQPTIAKADAATSAVSFASPLVEAVGSSPRRGRSAAAGTASPAAADAPTSVAAASGLAGLGPPQAVPVAPGVPTATLAATSSAPAAMEVASSSLPSHSQQLPAWHFAPGSLFAARDDAAADSAKVGKFPVVQPDKNLTRQDNDYDCGLFAAAYFESFVTPCLPHVTSEHVAGPARMRAIFGSDFIGSRRDVELKRQAMRQLVLNVIGKRAECRPPTA